MHTNKKADRVIWQVTDTTEVPILGRTQVKLMNYISYMMPGQIGQIWWKSIEMMPSRIGQIGLSNWSNLVEIH